MQSNRSKPGGKGIVKNGMKKKLCGLKRLKKRRDFRSKKGERNREK